MARVPYVPVAAIDQAHRDLLDRPINLGRALVNSSDGYGSHHRLGSWIREGSTLDPRLRELVILMVGWVTRSPYAWSHHVRIGRRFGVSDDDIRDVGRLAAGVPVRFDETERTVLLATIELTRDGTVGDDLWSCLDADFTPELLVEFVLVAGYYSHVTRVLSALRIDVEPEYEPLLTEFPLPTFPPTFP
jgi:alkylhydroperoxidase family enzyme